MNSTDVLPSVLFHIHIGFQNSFKVFSELFKVWHLPPTVLSSYAYVLKYKLVIFYPPVLNVYIVRFFYVVVYQFGFSTDN